MGGVVWPFRKNGLVLPYGGVNPRVLKNIYYSEKHFIIIMVRNNNKQMALAGGAAGALASMSYRQISQLAQAAGPLAGMARNYLNNRFNAPGGAPAPSRRKKSAPPPGPSMNRMAAPVAAGYTSNNLVRFSQQMATSKSTTYRGCSVLGSVRTSAAATTTLPQVSFYSASNPVIFPDRLQIMATTFDKYVYKSVKLKFQPQVPSSTAGLVAVCIDRDYMDPPQVFTWAQVLSYESAVSGSVWMEHSVSSKRETAERKTYFTNFTADVNFRDSEQYKFYVYTLGCPASTIIGQLYLEYEIELISPVYAPDEISSGLVNFQMRTSITGNISVPGVSGVFTLTGLPTVSEISSSLIEVITSGNLTAPAALLPVTVGTLGNTWVPPTQNSYRFYAKPVTGGYNLYLDYPSAIANNPSSNALYNPAAGAFNLITSSSVTYRLLNGTTPNT